MKISLSQRVAGAALLALALLTPVARPASALTVAVSGTQTPRDVRPGEANVPLFRLELSGFLTATQLRTVTFTNRTTGVGAAAEHDLEMGTLQLRLDDGDGVFESTDAVVGTAHAHVAPLLLDPGEQAPWLAQVQGAPDVRRVRVQVTSQPLTDALRAAATRDFRLDDVAVRPPADPYGPPTIGGTVVNVGAALAIGVEVTAAIFDADGALYQVARATALAPEIPPGQGVPFEIRPLGRGLKEIARYELFVVGRPQR